MTEQDEYGELDRRVTLLPRVTVEGVECVNLAAVLLLLRSKLYSSLGAQPDAASAEILASERRTSVAASRPRLIYWLTQARDFCAEESEYAEIDAIIYEAGASRSTPAASHRLQELAWGGALAIHSWFFDAAENIDAIDPASVGHSQPFDTCRHSDCTLVRLAGLRPEAAPATPPITGLTSDGYHTFDELYDYRKAFNALLFNQWAALGAFDVHKAWKHSDGEPCFGGDWFIVVAQTPAGQISNHYKAEDWDLFSIPERERSAEYDGHTPQLALQRMMELAVAAPLLRAVDHSEGETPPQKKEK